MRTMVAGSVLSRLAMARTLRRTNPRGCSRTGRRISRRLAVSRSRRSWRMTGCGADAAVSRFMIDGCRAASAQDHDIQGELTHVRHCQVALVVAAGRRIACWLLVGGRRFSRKAGGNDWLEKRHHGAQARTELLDGILLFGFALGEKILAAIFVFLDPFFGEAAVANLRQEFFHFIASLLGHDARACGVVTVLRGIADGVAHVAEAAAIDEIYDKFEFVEAFEIGDFRL